MALVVLTENNPFTAITTVLRRTAIIHIPMSIMVIRYYRNLGISWSWDGSGVSWQGLATSKNTLGQVAMVAAIYFLWEVMRNWKKDKWKSLNMLYFVMSVYLLKGSDDALSLTSLSVFVMALFIFWRLNVLHKKGKPYGKFVAFMMTCTLGLLFLFVLHSVVMFPEDSPFGWFIVHLGRDITLTDRTVIWGQVYDVAARNPLMGVGYGGFWIGRLANIPFTFPLTWTLAQSHNGYVDTYLQTGLIGVSLLLAILIRASKSLLTTIQYNFDAGRLFLTLLITNMYVNLTESTFLRGDHHMWFLLQVVIWHGFIRPSPKDDQDPSDPPKAINPLEHSVSESRHLENLGYS